MSRDDGFPRADIDTGLFADPKVVALARRLRDPLQTAAHVALYQALVLGSWGAGVRITFADALPAWWLEPADDIAANLRAVGLIDDKGYIPEHAWASWFLPAYDRRNARIDKATKGGQASSRARSRTWSEPEANPESTASEHLPTNQPTNHAQPSDPFPSLPTNPFPLTLAPDGARRDERGSSLKREPGVDRV